MKKRTIKESFNPREEAITVWVVETDYKSYLGYDDKHDCPEEETTIFSAQQFPNPDEAREYIDYAKDNYQWEFGKGYPNILKVTLSSKVWDVVPVEYGKGDVVNEDSEMTEWCDYPMTKEQAEICERFWGGDEDLAGEFEDAYEDAFGKSAWYWSAGDLGPSDDLESRPEEFSTEGYTSDYEGWGQDMVVDAVCAQGLTTYQEVYDYIEASLMKYAVSPRKADESFDKPVMPDTAVAGKPIAVRMAFAAEPGPGLLTIHSTRQCANRHEVEVFKKVMATGKPYDDDTLVAVPVLQRGVPKRYRGLLDKFGDPGKKRNIPYYPN